MPLMIVILIASTAFLGVVVKDEYFTPSTSSQTFIPVQPVQIQEPVAQTVADEPLLKQVPVKSPEQLASEEFYRKETARLKKLNDANDNLDWDDLLHPKQREWVDVSIPSGTDFPPTKPIKPIDVDTSGISNAVKDLANGVQDVKNRNKAKKNIDIFQACASSSARYIPECNK